MFAELLRHEAHPQIMQFIEATLVFAGVESVRSIGLANRLLLSCDVGLGNRRVVDHCRFPP